MPLYPLSTMLAHAHRNHYAIPAFNINFEQQAQAIVEAACSQNSPVIIQLSSGGLEFANPWMLKGLVAYLDALPIPICLHRDHTYDLATFTSALDMGIFGSIMMDGSICPNGTPRALDENIAITQKAKSLLAGHNVSIEAEIGCLGALESGDSGEEDGARAARKLTHSEMLTSPEQAAHFIEQVPVDALAIAIGTSHGAYKFSQPPSDKTLAIQRVKEINKLIPHQSLVLHGSSSVCQTDLARINRYGGSIPETYGVPVESICEAIPYGVCKVNIDTDLRLAFTAAIRQHSHDHPSNFDPRSYLSVAKDHMRNICINRMQAFGCKNQATALIQEHHENITT